MIGDTNSSMNVICDENQNESRDVDEGDNADNDDDNEKRDDEEKISIKTFRSSTPGWPDFVPNRKIPWSNLWIWYAGKLKQASSFIFYLDEATFGYDMPVLPAN